MDTCVDCGSEVEFYSSSPWMDGASHVCSDTLCDRGYIEEWDGETRTLVPTDRATHPERSNPDTVRMDEAIDAIVHPNPIVAAALRQRLLSDVRAAKDALEGVIPIAQHALRSANE